MLTVNLGIDGRVLELTAAEEILPGYVLERTAPDFAKYGIPHSHEDEICAPIVAVENRLAGRTINNAYAAGDKVFCQYCLPGDVFMGLAAIGVIINAGDLLSSAGNGRVHPVPGGVLGDGTIIGRALAASETEEAYQYFAVDGLSLEEVYAQAQGTFYAANSGINILSDRIPIEII